MSIEMCVLGSGSGGNATLVRSDGHCMLIDAGLGPRSVTKRLAGTGVSLDELRAIVLTHCDRDHFTPTWLNTLVQNRITVYCCERHLHALYRGLRQHPRGDGGRLLQRDNLLMQFGDQPFRVAPAGQTICDVRPVPLAHDDSGTSGFVVRSSSMRLGFATDLGRVPEALLEAFANADLLAMESNYDPAMELRSARPAMLKRRIMGGKGHLSNPEALNAILKVVKRSQNPPHHVALLHLSRECNDPAIIRQLYAQHPSLFERLTITSQHARTEWLGANGATQSDRPGVQYSLLDG